MDDFPTDRELYVHIAKMEEEGKHYNEMLVTMKQLVDAVDELTPDERRLLSVAYKKNILPLRGTWRQLSKDLRKESDESNYNLTSQLRQQVEAEMTGICRDGLSLTVDRLILSCRIEEPASSIFYFKMKADFLRYLAEITTDADEKKSASDKAMRTYETAMNLARMELTPVDPLRIAVALNFAVFYYEILRSTDSACKMANKAYSEAAADLDLYIFAGQVQNDTRDMMESLIVNEKRWKAKTWKKPPLAPVFPQY